MDNPKLIGLVEFTATYTRVNKFKDS